MESGEFQSGTSTRRTAAEAGKIDIFKKSLK